MIILEPQENVRRRLASHDIAIINYNYLDILIDFFQNK